MFELDSKGFHMIIYRYISALDIMSHYAHRYQLNFNADKTKIVVTGSRVDMRYYRDTRPWTLNGKRVNVVENNEHLGLIVSGEDEEQKNIDENISKCRNSLYALLGPAFAFRCLLSPSVQLHLWKTYSLPVLVSGLSALPIRPPPDEVNDPLPQQDTERCSQAQSNFSDPGSPLSHWRAPC